MAEFCRQCSGGWGEWGGKARTECILSRVNARLDAPDQQEKGEERIIRWKKVDGLLIHLPAGQQRLGRLKLGLIIRIHVCPGGGRNSKIFGKNTTSAQAFKKKK